MLAQILAWINSAIIPNWLTGKSRHFKTYVGNHVSYILDIIRPDHWNYVNGAENLADCSSREVLPSELIEHKLRGNGSNWAQQTIFSLIKRGFCKLNHRKKREKNPTQMLLINVINFWTILLLHVPEAHNILDTLIYWQSSC